MVFFSIALYRCLFWLTSFYWAFFLRRRIDRGKEDAERWPERLGKSTLKRPPQRLIWIHAVSVGESLAVLPLIARLPEIYPDHKKDIQILLTTVTVSSAAIIKDRLPAYARHQYMVLDHPLYVRRFLSHWRPDMAIWVESELWPNMLTEVSRRKIPMALINARLSPRALRNWLRVKRLAGFLLSLFDICLAQSEANAKALRQLGAKHVMVSGNLKYDAPPLAADADMLALWRARLADRKVFLAASTHAGEEQHIARAHIEAQKRNLNLITIIAPRHPARGRSISEEMRAYGLSTGRLSEIAIPQSMPDIYIADRLGMLGLFYRLAHVVFMGGSLISHGGQNPLEPARLSCALLSGRHVFNFAEIYDHLSRSGGVRLIDEKDLAAQLIALLSDAGSQREMSQQAQKVADELKGALDQTLSRLKPLIGGL